VILQQYFTYFKTCRYADSASFGELHYPALTKLITGFLSAADELVKNISAGIYKIKAANA